MTGKQPPKSSKQRPGETELKDCPFCGGYPHHTVMHSEARLLVCSGCGSSTDAYHTYQQAVDAWNRRVSR